MGLRKIQKLPQKVCDVYIISQYLCLQVEDIPDQGPEWISLRSVSRIPEDAPTFTPVTALHLPRINRSLERVAFSRIFYAFSLV